MADQGIELTNAGSQSGGGQRPPVERPAESYEWPEVKYSSYAISLSYLMMAMRGLNILIFTWSTVVLLGGFVSMLQKKDFWCLTIITLVQVPGLFNPNVHSKIIWLQHLPKGFGAIVPTSGLLEASRAWHIVGRAAQVAAAPLAVVGGICLMLVVAFGVPIAAGLSLWRLMQRDYGVAEKDDGSKANLTPALDVLYSLVVLQSTLFLLCSVFDVAGLRLAEAVIKEYQVGGSERQLFEAYFAETKMGCCKDLSFADGRNLVTYAVGMMGSDAPRSYVAGVRILGSLFGPQWPLAVADRSSLDRSRRTSILMHRWAEVDHLLTRSSSNGHVVQRLLRTVGPLNPYGTEAREAAARVVRLISHDIYLEQLPGGIQCIASLLEISEEHRALLIHGLDILYQLAADERNCRVMSDTPDLLSMLVAPLSFHADHDAVCQEAARKSLYVVHRLLNAQGETGAKLQHQIETDEQAVSAMDSILECDQCCADLQEQVIIFLEFLHFCKHSGKASNQRRAKFIRILVSIFAGDKRHEATVRIKAAHTLGHLCTAHSGDVEYPLKEDIINGIRKVQNVLICCESSGGAEANDQGFSEPSTTDLEANVVRLISNDIYLEQFPQGIRCISCLLEISEEHRALLIHGLNILYVLVADERNCRVVGDTPDLLSMLVAPVSFHADHDAVCQEAALKSLNVVGRLLNAQGETGAKLQHQIETGEQTVSAMESILECDQCRADLQEGVIIFLEFLHFCKHSGKASNQRREKFIRILLSIAAGDKKHEATVRIKAAHTLGHLCNTHSGDVEYPLKEEIINGIRKAQNELNCFDSSGGAEANDRGFSEPCTDLEAQLPSQDNGCNGASSSNQQNNEPHGRHCSKGKQKKYRKGGKHGKRSRMMMASLEEEQEPFLC